MLKPCPECGHEVSTKAEKCPNCGYPIRPIRTNLFFGRPTYKIDLIVVVILMLMVFAAMSWFS